MGAWGASPPPGMQSLDKRHAATLVAAITLLVTAGCSSHKNTAGSRWWQSFNTRYNTYYNGSLAYIEGSLEKESGNKDNFTEIIPLYTVANKASKDLGSANFDRSIEKAEKCIKLHSIKKRPVWNKNRKKRERDIEWLNRKEYNPFMWKAWMLLGRSQFMKGDFDEAASTFSYMSRLYATQPPIYGKARAWLAKCYVEQDWLYDAEDIITKIRRDSIHWSARKEWDYTYADYYIRAGRYEEAIPYLRKVIRHEMRRKQKAREWFLMGQLQEATGNKGEAYRSFRRIVRLNPPYEVEFNARIAMTEVLADRDGKKMVRRLKRMARSDNNAEYLDQVYYAIGNIYLSQKDTASAIAAYEKGNAKSTRNGIEKGVLLLALGDLYWERESYADAQRCYGEAIGLLDTDHREYKRLSGRSRVLDELVPHTEAVHLQDSLQELARMPEAERNAAIDRVIEELKRKEREERRAQQEAEALQALGNQGGNEDIRNQSATSTESGTWYFYNPTAVSQGKTTFQRQWGNRQNADDWQRANKTVVSMPTWNEAEEELTDEQRDSLALAEALQDSIKNSLDSAQNDPHKREYYLKMIPFTEEQVAASNILIGDGLFHSGVIFKDKLDNLPRSEKALTRLTTAEEFSGFERMDEAYYHLFLLYSRMGMHERAATYVARLRERFPESQWTTLLTDPHFVEDARFGVHMEDSLYAATYDAFKADRHREVEANTALSAGRFPLGANRDKFIFIGGLSKLNDGDSQGCLEDMQEVVTKFPGSEVSEMAGMIINGVQAGRELHGGKFDMGDVWSRRSVVLNDSDSINARAFVAERDVGFSFLIAYSPDSLNENRLLYDVARFNFTNFIVRNFDIEIDAASGIHRMRTSGFRSYDEALQYARELYGSETVMADAEKGKAIIISDANLELLGNQFSYEDYDQFYEEHFVPLTISTVRLLTEPESIEYDRRVDDSPGAGEEEEGLYNGGVIEEGLFVDDGGYVVEDEPDEWDEEASPEGEPEEESAGEGETGTMPTEEVAPTEPAPGEGTGTEAGDEGYGVGLDEGTGTEAGDEGYDFDMDEGTGTEAGDEGYGVGLDEGTGMEAGDEGYDFDMGTGTGMDAGDEGYDFDMGTGTGMDAGDEGYGIGLDEGTGMDAGDEGYDFDMDEGTGGPYLDDVEEVTFDDGGDYGPGGDGEDSFDFDDGGAGYDRYELDDEYIDFDGF